MYLVGSQAIAFYHSDFMENRKSYDYDFLCTKEQFKELVQRTRKDYSLIELKFISARNAFAKFKTKDSFFVIDASFLDVEGDLYESDNELVNTKSEYGNSYFSYLKHTIFLDGKIPVECLIAKPFTCFIMKLSHRYKKDSPHFDKTRRDILWFKSIGMSYPFDRVFSPFEQVLKNREAQTYKNKLPNLNQGKQNFFDSSVNYVYDHDTIHEAVKHLDRPAYTYYIREGSEVFCSKDKFFDLPQIVRLYGVLEESYVLALERAVIPHGTDPLRAFTIALEKVCTSVTSGWFREFAYNNYDAVFAMYHESYVDKFKKALDNGQIKPHGH